jgi:hypothetical protein
VAAGWQPKDGDRPLILVGRPYDGHSATPANGQMTALLAPSREAVDRFHATALAKGGLDEGAPGSGPRTIRTTKARTCAIRTEASSALAVTIPNRGCGIEMGGMK